MKSRVNEFLDKSISAMVSAIEIYNKPDFLYREEIFSILAVNSWELLLKAKWVKNNGGKINSLYVYEKKKKKNGETSKTWTIKRTVSKNPLTHSLDYLAKHLIENQSLQPIVWENLTILVEIRNSSIHFYNRNTNFQIRLQEVGMATLKNYVIVVQEWFKKNLSQYNFYLMPLAFVEPSKSNHIISLNKEEENLIQYISTVESKQSNLETDFSIALNIDIKFTRSKVKEALEVRLTNEANAIPIQLLKEEEIRRRYCWDYNKLEERLKERYSDFKFNEKYHTIRKQLEKEARYCHVVKLDPENPKSSKKKWYDPNILQKFDEHYKK